MRRHGVPTAPRSQSRRAVSLHRMRSAPTQGLHRPVSPRFALSLASSVPGVHDRAVADAPGPMLGMRTVPFAGAAFALRDSAYGPSPWRCPQPRSSPLSPPGEGDVEHVYLGAEAIEGAPMTTQAGPRRRR